MSLDVYLYETAEVATACPHCGGRFPTRVRTGREVHWANITHNLGRMAEAAGVYGVLWRPGETGAATAADVAGPLREGLRRLEADPDFYRAFDSPNGWGTYDGFVRFVRAYLAACDGNPTAEVEVSL